LTAGDGAIFSALDMAIKIPIGIVIDGATGAAHQKSAEGKDNQQIEGWHSFIG
jgi:hypothetical protein